MKARGMAMVEALVASALLGMGLLGATRLVTHALSAALQTRQEVQAQALASEALGCATARTEPCPLAATVQHQGVGYTVQLQLSPLGRALSEVQAQVQWRSSPGDTPASAQIARTVQPCAPFAARTRAQAATRSCRRASAGAR